MEIRQVTPSPEVVGSAATGVPAWSAPATIMPRVDILDTGDHVVYLMDVAGADPDKLVLEISRSEVAVSGPLSDKIPQGTPLYAERPRGTYARLLALPGDVDPDGVTADLTNGVLVVRFNKKRRKEHEFRKEHEW